KEHVIFDLEGQLTRTDTGLGFLRNYGLVVDLTPDKRGYKLKNIRGEKESVALELKVDTIDERLRNALNGTWNGEGGMKFSLTKQDVTDLEVKIKDFVVFRYSDLDELSFVQAPFWKGEVQVEFPERECSIEGLQVKCYNLKNLTRITASKNGFQIEIDSQSEEGAEPGFYFKFRMPEIIKQTSHAIEFLNVLDCIISGVQMVIYSKDLREEISYSPSKIDENREIEELLKSFCSIRTIEKYFKIKFMNTNLKQINGDLPIIKTIESLINDGWAAVDGNDIVMMYEESFDTIKNNIEAIGPEQFVKCSYLNVPWKVLGRKIEIGRCQVSIKGPRIIENYPEKQMARIRSTDEKIYLKYERTNSNHLKR